MAVSGVERSGFGGPLSARMEEARWSHGTAETVSIIVDVCETEL